MPESLHCKNFEPHDPRCQTCPGKVEVTHPDGTVDTLCRAGEKAIREATAENNLPVFPVRFPAPEQEIPTIAAAVQEVLDRLKRRMG